MNSDYTAFLIGMAAGAAPLCLILRSVIRDAARNRTRAFHERELRAQGLPPTALRSPAGPMPIEYVVGTAE